MMTANDDNQIHDDDDDDFIDQPQDDDDDDFIDNTCQQVERLAREHGWHLDDGDGYARWNLASTRSRYVELCRSREVIDDDGDEDTEYQTVKVRVSNHHTVYAREDVSLCPDPSPDDHTIGHLERVLSGPFVSDY